MLKLVMFGAVALGAGAIVNGAVGDATQVRVRDFGIKGSFVSRNAETGDVVLRNGSGVELTLKPTMSTRVEKNGFLVSFAAFKEGEPINFRFHPATMTVTKISGKSNAAN